MADYKVNKQPIWIILSAAIDLDYKMVAASWKQTLQLLRPDCNIPESWGSAILLYVERCLLQPINAWAGRGMH